MALLKSNVTRSVMRERGQTMERGMSGPHATQTESAASSKGLTAMGEYGYAASPIQCRTKSSSADGLPVALKNGIEELSGMGMDNVKVHYNSNKPAQLQALAYAQGKDIHLGPGQERHLPHEAWHVVQQAQGRVRATMQMHGSVPLNDEPRLEREADAMGARAAGMQVAMPDVVRDPVIQSRADAVLQGVFPDARNDARADEQPIPREKVQLDHMVSQARLAAFAETYKVLAELTGGGTKWEETEAAMVRLRAEVAKVPRNPAHEFMSESHLVNMMENIVPGRVDQVQGAESQFDPQIAASSEMIGGNLTRFEETEQSKQQRQMDTLIVRLNNLVHKDSLPTKPSERNKGAKLDQDTDEFLAQQIDALAQTFELLSQADVSVYDAAVWDNILDSDRVVDTDKWVKKRPADWVNDAALLPELGGVDAPQHEATTSNFTFQTKALKGDGNASLVPVTVNVNITMPAETWSHIYDRHYLPSFAGKVEAVNTFWKDDPYTFLTSEAGQTLMEGELQQMLERSFNFSKPYDSVEDNDFEEVSWSRAAEKLFFQGNADLTATKLAGPAALEYEVDITIKSIAPQDAALAFAITPEKLRDEYESRHA